MGGPFDFLGDLGGSIAGLINHGDQAGDRDKINQNLQDLINQSKGLGSSEFANISTDPTTRAYQLKALGQLADMGLSGGNDAQSQAAMADARNKSAQFEQGQRGAILNSMGARGMGGSGAEMASLMSAQQHGANRDSSAGLEAAAQSRQRAMQALGQMGNMASGIRGQDWSEAAQRAAAMDAAKRAQFDAQSSATNGFNSNLKQNDATQNAMWQGLGKGIGGYFGNNANLGASFATGGMSGMAGMGAPSGGAYYGNGLYSPNQNTMDGLASMNPASVPETSQYQPSKLKDDEWANPYGG